MGRGRGIVVALAFALAFAGVACQESTPIEPPAPQAFAAEPATRARSAAAPACGRSFTVALPEPPAEAARAAAEARQGDGAIADEALEALALAAALEPTGRDCIDGGGRLGFRWISHDQGAGYAAELGCDCGGGR